MANVDKRDAKGEIYALQQMCGKKGAPSNWALRNEKKLSGHRVLTKTRAQEIFNTREDRALNVDLCV